jgi:hypothetical protein
LGNNIGPIEIEDIAAWLREAFVLSREIPQILQKVFLSILMLLFMSILFNSNWQSHRRGMVGSMLYGFIGDIFI